MMYEWSYSEGKWAPLDEASLAELVGERDGDTGAEKGLTMSQPNPQR
jgi:hypothetical protein